MSVGVNFGEIVGNEPRDIDGQLFISIRRVSRVLNYGDGYVAVNSPGRFSAMIAEFRGACVEQGNPYDSFVNTLYRRLRKS